MTSLSHVRIMRFPNLPTVCPVCGTAAVGAQHRMLCQCRGSSPSHSPASPAPPCPPPPAPASRSEILSPGAQITGSASDSVSHAVMFVTCLVIAKVSGGSDPGSGVWVVGGADHGAGPCSYHHLAVPLQLVHRLRVSGGQVCLGSNTTINYRKAFGPQLFKCFSVSLPWCLP